MSLNGYEENLIAMAERAVLEMLVNARTCDARGGKSTDKKSLGNEKLLRHLRARLPPSGFHKGYCISPVYGECMYLHDAQ
jgi:hypothetical protein